MAKKKTKIKIKTSADIFLSKLIKSRKSDKDITSYIQLFKYGNTYGDIIELYKKLPLRYKNLLYKDLFPYHLKHINNKIDGYYDDNLEANFNSMLALFNIENKKVNLFLEQKKEFEKNFIFSKFDISQDILSKSVETISHSNWYIYHSLLIKEHIEGFEGTFSLLKELLDNGAEHPLNHIFLFRFTKMVDKDLSVEEYRTHLEHEIYQHYNIFDKEIKQFVQAYIDPFEIFFYPDIKGVFIGEESTALIDQYLTFRKLLINLIQKDEFLALNTVKKALKFINDPQLDKIYFLISGDLSFYKDTNENTKIYLILDLYTQGKYLECSKVSKEYLLNNTISIYNGSLFQDQ